MAFPVSQEPWISEGRTMQLEPRLQESQAVPCMLCFHSQLELLQALMKIKSADVGAP